eukprot:gene5156-3705_t
MLQGSDSSSNLVISEQFHHPAKTVRRRVVASSAAHKTPPEGGTHQLFFLDSIGLTSARYLCVAMYRRGITRIPLGRPQKAARTATTKKEKKRKRKQEKKRGKISAIVTLRAACKRPAISNNRKEAVQFRTWEEKIKEKYLFRRSKRCSTESPGVSHRLRHCIAPKEPQHGGNGAAGMHQLFFLDSIGLTSARYLCSDAPSHGARAPLAPCANLAHHPTAVALASPLQLENECWERFAKGKEEEHNRTGLVNAVAEMPWLLAITTDGGRTHAPAERAQRIHTTPHPHARTHVEWRSGSGRRGSELLSNVIPRNSHQPHQLSRVTCKKDHVLNRRRDEQLASACHNPSAIRLSHMRMTTSHKHKRRLHFASQFHHPAKTVRRRVVASSAAHKTPPEGGTHQLFFLDSIGLTSARYLCVAMYRRGITRIPLGRPQKAARTATTKCCQPLTTLHTRPTCCKGNRQKRKEKKRKQEKKRGKISAIVTLRAACKRPAISNNRKEAVQFRTWEEKIKEKYLFRRSKRCSTESPGVSHRLRHCIAPKEPQHGGNDICVAMLYRRVITRIPPAQPWCTGTARTVCYSRTSPDRSGTSVAAAAKMSAGKGLPRAKGGEKEEEHNRTGLVNAVAEMPWLLAITTDGGRTHAPAERAQRIHTIPHPHARTHVEWRSGSGRRGSELLSNVIPRNSHQPHQLSRVTCKKDHVLNRRRDEQLASACHNPSAIRLSHMRMTTSHKHKRRLHFASQFHHPAKTVRRRVVASSAAHKTPPEGGTHQLFFLDSIGLTSARYLCVAMYRRGITRIPLGRPQKAARTATTKKEKKRKRKQEKKRGKISAIVTLRAACKRPAISNNRKEAVQFRTWEEKIKEKYLFRRSKRCSTESLGVSHRLRHCIAPKEPQHGGNGAAGMHQLFFLDSIGLTSARYLCSDASGGPAAVVGAQSYYLTLFHVIRISHISYPELHDHVLNRRRDEQLASTCHNPSAIRLSHMRMTTSHKHKRRLHFASQFHHPAKTVRRRVVASSAAHKTPPEGGTHQLFFLDSIGLTSARYLCVAMYRRGITRIPLGRPQKAARTATTKCCQPLTTLHTRPTCCKGNRQKRKEKKTETREEKRKNICDLPHLGGKDKRKIIVSPLQKMLYGEPGRQPQAPTLHRAEGTTTRWERCSGNASALDICVAMLYSIHTTPHPHARTHVEWRSGSGRRGSELLSNVIPRNSHQPHQLSRVTCKKDHVLNRRRDEQLASACHNPSAIRLSHMRMTTSHKHKRRLHFASQFHHPAKTVRRRVVASSAAHKTPPEGGTHQLFFLDSIGLTSARYLCVAMYRRGITRIPLGRPQKAARTATMKKEKKRKRKQEKKRGKISAIVTLRAACKRPAISNNRKEAVQFRTWEEKIKEKYLFRRSKRCSTESPGVSHRLRHCIAPKEPQHGGNGAAGMHQLFFLDSIGLTSARYLCSDAPSHGARAPLAPCANLAHHPTAVALASPLQLENECWERFAKGKEEEHNRTGLVNAVAEMPWLLAITTDGGRTHAPAERAQRIHTTPHHTARTHVEWRSGSGRRGSELLSNVIPRNSHQPHQLSRVTCKKDHVLNRRRDEQLASACHNPSAIRLSHMRMTTSHKHKRRLHFASQFHHPAKTVRRRVVASSAAHKTPPEGGTHQLFFLDSIGLTSARYLCVAMYRRGITRIPLGRPQKAARTATTKCCQPLTTLHTRPTCCKGNRQKEKKRKRKQEKKRGKISAIVTLRAACKRPAISNNRKEAVQFRTWEEKIKEKYLFRRSKDALRRAGRQPQAPTLHRAEGTTTRWERCSGNASALDICVAMLYRRVITRIPPAQPWCTGTARTVENECWERFAKGGGEKEEEHNRTGLVNAVAEMPWLLAITTDGGRTHAPAERAQRIHTTPHPHARTHVEWRSGSGRRGSELLSNVIPRNSHQPHQLSRVTCKKDHVLNRRRDEQLASACHNPSAIRLSHMRMTTSHKHKRRLHFASQFHHPAKTVRRRVVASSAAHKTPPEGGTHQLFFLDSIGLTSARYLCVAMYRRGITRIPLGRPQKAARTATTKCCQPLTTLHTRPTCCKGNRQKRKERKRKQEKKRGKISAIVTLRAACKRPAISNNRKEAVQFRTWEEKIKEKYLFRRSKRCSTESPGVSHRLRHCIAPKKPQHGGNGAAGMHQLFFLDSIGLTSARYLHHAHPASPAMVHGHRSHRVLISHITRPHENECWERFAKGQGEKEEEHNRTGLVNAVAEMPWLLAITTDGGRTHAPAERAQRIHTTPHPHARTHVEWRSGSGRRGSELLSNVIPRNSHQPHQLSRVTCKKDHVLNRRRDEQLASACHNPSAIRLSHMRMTTSHKHKRRLHFASQFHHPAKTVRRRVVASSAAHKTPPEGGTHQLFFLDSIGLTSARYLCVAMYRRGITRIPPAMVHVGSREVWNRYLLPNLLLVLRDAWMTIDAWIDVMEVEKGNRMGETSNGYIKILFFFLVPAVLANFFPVGTADNDECGKSSTWNELQWVTKQNQGVYIYIYIYICVCVCI